MQVVLAGWLLRRLGVSRALWLLPITLGAGALGFALTGALVPMLLIKIFDGSLRHSLHKTGTELLYLPLAARLRERHKVTIDAVGARGGQALASLAVLGALSIGLDLPVIAFGLVAMVALLLWSVAEIKRHYVELFREQLRQGTIETRMAVPALDLHSLEALIAGVSSTDDAVALAAIDLLAASGRANLVPPLILYHPSSEVVVRALAVLGENGRRDHLPIARRLVGSPDAEVRAAALRAVAAADEREDEALLREALADPAPAVRATALVSLVCRQCGDDIGRHELDKLKSSPDPASRVALVRAIRFRPGPAFHPLLRELAAAPEPELHAQVARTMAADPDPSFLPVLLPMLADRTARAEARAAIVAIGRPALEHLDRALAEPDVPRRVRLHLPRTISKFGDQAAVDVLVRHMEPELDTIVGYKILRGLGRMISDDHRLEIDRSVIDRSFEAALRRAITLLDWRVRPDRADPGRARARTGPPGADRCSAGDDGDGQRRAPVRAPAREGARVARARVPPARPATPGRGLPRHVHRAPHGSRAHGRLQPRAARVPCRAARARRHLRPARARGRLRSPAARAGGRLLPPAGAEPGRAPARHAGRLERRAGRAGRALCRPRRLRRAGHRPARRDGGATRALARRARSGGAGAQARAGGAACNVTSPARRRGGSGSSA